MENGIGQQTAGECGHRKHDVNWAGENLNDSSREQGNYAKVEYNATTKSAAN